ncbi:anti-sigma F factor [Salipaludibacillus keqinensis]|uniref:Anti-sigma F factor n=1 Tax=Salipaludibacillus keqinensis TaxID=2045207 RepID=A0A323TL30_9BACI|nr:anti-sigma F factor [Salipaludibacillus keqinensis]PYZ94437.1 anti-sigma F factor [Salipaludibacillus keqinensis]
MKNRMELSFLAVSANESFARVSVGAFVTQLDPTMDELTEIKTVVSEAVTNAIIHGYGETDEGFVHIEVELIDGTVYLIIRDDGHGIVNLDEARQPLYTSKPELERSGMGFTIMENFMDNIEVESEPMTGTTVTLVKRLSKQKALCN